MLASLNPDIPLAYHTEFFDLPARSERAKKVGVAAWVDPKAYRERIAETRARFEQLIAEEEE